MFKGNHNVTRTSSGDIGKFFIEEFRLLCFILLCNDGDKIGDGENDKDDFSFRGILCSFMLLLLLLLLSLM